ncbi:hypothetical protein GQR60_12760 [Labilibaculum sp. A4]|uniref:Uncharacterized protein n=1 Tax=Labilibaculum euxinus TaxID=2686357 RepID=A0A7M4D2K7_9BACT|nr:hypothetical protein [Labilibaculum euxinus]MDQ1772976.1 hypothetical protein [Labilibaculum euxinus]MUP36886.1 hypothetical protein [Labilibaculum euxinus]MVB06091.1 hypothetical protein [Labilibaculum euxinus]MWN77211.1 hypothetical protein [Labilibaculum euxinus]
MKICIINILFFVMLMSASAQIYNQKKIYQFEVAKTDAFGSIQQEDLFLVCHGKAWKLDPRNQFLAVWCSSNMDKFGLNYQTGIIENENRIWLHPPRNDQYMIHEYSPFPEIRFPLAVGNKWETDFGCVWENRQFKITANDKVFHLYEVVSIEKVYSDLKQSEIDCYKIVGTINHPKIKTKWIGWFNSELGFVKMTFYNLDHSITEMCLKDSYNWEEHKNNFLEFKL